MEFRLARKCRHLPGGVFFLRGLRGLLLKNLLSTDVDREPPVEVSEVEPAQALQAGQPEDFDTSPATTQWPRPKDAPESKPEASEPGPVRQVFEYWRKAAGKGPRTQLDSKRKRAVKARPADGYTVAELCEAVDGCLLTPTTGARTTGASATTTSSSSAATRLTSTGFAATPRRRPSRARRASPTVRPERGHGDAAKGLGQVCWLRWCGLERVLERANVRRLFAQWFEARIGRDGDEAVLRRSPSPPAATRGTELIHGTAGHHGAGETPRLGQTYPSDGPE